jgi:hypothetical protein
MPQRSSKEYQSVSSLHQTFYRCHALGAVGRISWTCGCHQKLTISEKHFAVYTTDIHISHLERYSSTAFELVLLKGTAAF